MSEILFSDTVTCEKCGAVDFFNGLCSCQGKWLCKSCSKGFEDSSDVDCVDAKQANAEEVLQPSAP